MACATCDTLMWWYFLTLIFIHLRPLLGLISVLGNEILNEKLLEITRRIKRKIIRNNDIFFGKLLCIHRYRNCLFVYVHPHYALFGYKICAYNFFRLILDVIYLFILNRPIMYLFRPKFSPLGDATRGVHRRSKISANEGNGQPKKDLRPNQDRSQTRENATRDAYHWLKASTDRRNSRQEESHLIQDWLRLKTTTRPL